MLLLSLHVSVCISMCQHACAVCLLDFIYTTFNTYYARNTFVTLFCFFQNFLIFTIFNGEIAVNQIDYRYFTCWLTSLSDQCILVYTFSCINGSWPGEQCNCIDCIPGLDTITDPLIIAAWINIFHKVHYCYVHIQCAICLQVCYYGPSDQNHSLSNMSKVLW